MVGPTADIDPWLLAGMPGPLRHASYLVERLAPQYRLIVDVLLETQSHSLTGVARADLPTLLHRRAESQVGPDMSRRLLEGSTFDIDARMEQLRAWGVVEVWQDRAAIEADFLRNRDRYQLTPRAAALHRFVLEAERDSSATTSTALLAPSVIATRLDELRTALGENEWGLADEAWAQVELSIRDMASAAGAWQAQLAAALAGAPDEGKLATLRSTVLAYVEVWGSGVDVHSPRIARSVEELRGYDRATWRRLAMIRLGAEVPEDAIDAQATAHVTTLHTLGDWFGGPDGQGRRLRRQVRDVIGDLVRGHRAMLHVGGAVTRRAELLRVAAAIERSRTDHEGWAVWCRCTGLFAARHLGVLAPDRTDVGRHTSWWDAPPAAVQARLRAQGHRALVGRPAQIRSTAAARARARHEAAARRRALVEAEAGIRRRSGLPLSAWGTLTGEEMDLLIDLLAAARGPAGGYREGPSADGRWLVRVTPARGPSAVIGAPGGALVCADAVVEIAPA